MVSQLTGPRILSRSGITQNLVIFLHGYGSNGDDLISIGAEWINALPNTSFVSPNAPFPCPGVPYGFQWFPLQYLSQEELWEGSQSASLYLEAFIQSEMERYNIKESQIALVGFSQGTMMSLYIGLKYYTPFAGIIGYSGRLCLEPNNEEVSLKSLIRNKTPVFLAHGDMDTVVQYSSLSKTEKYLDMMEVPCETYTAAGLGHSIDHEEIKRGLAFLKRCFSTVEE